MPRLSDARSTIAVGTPTSVWNRSGNRDLATFAARMDATVTSRTMLSWLLAAWLVLTAASAFGQDFFTDDFGDGDPYDGVPVAWLKGGEYSGGVRDASSGDWHWTPAGTVPMTSWVPYTYTDVSIHGQVRVLGPSDGFTGFFARNVGYDGYNAGLALPDELIITKTVNNDWTTWKEPMTDFELIGNDIHIQFDLFGSTLSLTVWRDGEPRPEPQMRIEDDTLFSGVVGLGHNPGSTNEPAVWRFFEIFPEPFRPEPSGLRPGDANQDLAFDRLDLIHVLQGGKYLTGQPATWGEGDWNGGPGGTAGDPPEGDGVFDQLDMVAALSTGVYDTGPYAAVPAGDRGWAVAVPEPSAYMIALPGTLMLLMRLARQGRSAAARKGDGPRCLGHSIGLDRS